MNVRLARRRALRRNSTDAEAALWFHLRAGRFVGFKFRRQLSPLSRGEGIGRRRG